MEKLMSYISLIFSLISGVFALSTFLWGVRKNRQQATLDAFNRLQGETLDKLYHYRPQEIADISKHPLGNEYKTISTYVARIEHFCVGVNRRIYDKRVVHDLASGFLDGAIKSRITPLIEQKNKSGNDYYANIHQVYKWMEKKQIKDEKKKKRREKWLMRKSA